MMREHGPISSMSLPFINTVTKETSQLVCTLQHKIRMTVLVIFDPYRHATKKPCTFQIPSLCQQLGIINCQLKRQYTLYLWYISFPKSQQVHKQG